MGASDSIREDVNRVCAGILDGYKPRLRCPRKIVRDPVVGFEYLEPHEIPIIDSPIFQRLRRIRQTALAYQVYPTANHTRFEHCLGVAHREMQMVDALNQKRPGFVSEQKALELRFAGLLHDVGHGPFSHLSETIFGQQFEWQLKALATEDPRFVKKGLGEVLSYFIVTSDAFRALAGSVFEACGVTIDLDTVAGYFIGAAPTDNDQFLAEIISGSCDADKLDYFERDCYYTGIRAEIDTDRILAVSGADHLQQDAALFVRLPPPQDPRPRMRREGCLSGDLEGSLWAG